MEKFHVFGDESVNGNHVVYAWIMVPSERVDAVSSIFAKVKRDFGGGVDARFHCRELFHRHQREKGPWKHLNNRQSYEFAAALTTALAGKGIGTVAGHVNRSTAPLEILGVGELPGTKIVDSKQLIPFAYTSLLGIFIANKDYEDSLFWAEPISGKVLWGTDRRQVGQLMHAYVIDIDRNIAEKKFQPENLETKQWHPLLELADLLAYCTSFAVANKGVTLTRYGDRVKMSIFNSMAPNISTFTWLDGPTGMWSNLSLSN